MKRYDIIDYLRGVAIILTILTHTLSYYLKVPGIFTFWDRIHFVVPIFVFVSAYISAKKGLSKESFFPTLIKRIWRLLAPYYIFLIAFFILVSFAEPSRLTTSFFVTNLFVTGGVDINWLVLLFIYLALMLPALLSLYKYAKPAYFTLMAVSLSSSLVLLFYHPPFGYKLYMWLPWLSVAFAAITVANHDKKNSVIKILIASIAVFIISQTYLSLHRGTFTLFSHKYPPDIYYLSHGLSWTMGLYIFFTLFKPSGVTKNILNFSSTYSYTLYFFHYLVIYIIVHFFSYKSLSVWIFTLIVFSLTYLLQWLTTRLQLKH